MDPTSSSLSDHLPGWTVLSAATRGSDRQVLVTSAAPALACDVCGADGNHLTGYGFNVSSFREAPLLGVRTVLSVRRRRHRCARCEALGSQPLPLTDDRHRITIRCRDQIVEQAARLPLAQVADQIGVSRATVQSLAPAKERRAGRPKRVELATTNQCGFCRRIFDSPADMHVHHARPGRDGRNISEAVPVCPDCHVHLATIGKEGGGGE